MGASWALGLRELSEIHGEGQLLCQRGPPPLIPGQDVAHHAPKGNQQQTQDVGKDPFRGEGAVGVPARAERAALCGPTHTPTPALSVPRANRSACQRTRP